MWQRYTNNQGFCLEYSLMSFVKAHIIINPVCYIETKSFGDIFKLFGESERAKLLICVKEKYGVDKYSDSGELINWEKQKEWRYLLYNEKDENGKNKVGLYSKNQIKPDAVYVKGLNPEWLKKVERAASVNRIPVKVINANLRRKIYEWIRY